MPDFWSEQKKSTPPLVFAESFTNLSLMESVLGRPLHWHLRRLRWVAGPFGESPGPLPNAALSSASTDCHYPCHQCVPLTDIDSTCNVGYPRRAELLIFNNTNVSMLRCSVTSISSPRLLALSENNTCFKRIALRAKSGKNEKRARSEGQRAFFLFQTPIHEKLVFFPKKFQHTDYTRPLHSLA